MAALGMKDMRPLEDKKTGNNILRTLEWEQTTMMNEVLLAGPLILSHAYQQRTHLLEEGRSYYLQHQKRQVGQQKTNYR